MAIKGKVSVNTENIFPIIKKFLYTDHEIFLRELISNAVDATQKLKVFASKGDAVGQMEDLKITVKLDEEKKTLTISDNGIGMTEEEIDKYINQIAFSGAEEFVEMASRKLDIPVDGTTNDGLFTLKTVMCLAACDRAPMLQCNLKFEENLDEAKFDALITRLRAEAAAENSEPSIVEQISAFAK